MKLILSIITYNLIFLLLPLCTQSCKTKQPLHTNSPATDTMMPYVFKYERGPCFGQCPVYSFYLLSDHTGLLYAKANLLDTPGWYFTQLDQESIVEIIELLEPAEWWSPDLGYQPEIPDLPPTTIIYHHPLGIRNITVQSRTTSSLENVFEKVNKLVTEGKWESTLIRPFETNIPDKRTDVIVQLKPGIDIQTWMKKFEHFGIQLKKRIAPNQSYYLVSKDPVTGNSNDFLQYIKLDPDVIDAQWDMPVKQRE